MNKIINKILDFLISKTMNIIDYIGAVATLIASLYFYINQEDYLLYLVVGVIALLFAIFRPTKYFIEMIRIKPQKID